MQSLISRPFCSRRLLGILALLGFACSILFLPETLAAADPPSKWEITSRETTGGFIMSLVRDGNDVWIGTEDKGIVHIPAKENPLLPGGQTFTRKDAAPDNGYALCFDGQHRLWAGSLRNGVSVYNADKWRSYDVLDGPIGERIFAIATCPTDGDVWMATSAGLTRYSQKNDSWSYVTRAPSTQREQVTGLPSDQANAIAFNAKGDIFVGTQCDGIAMAKAVDEYKKWTNISGPISLPITPTGRGLPTALINGLLVSKTGTVYAATSAGLAWSKDAGKTWAYLRGKDYADKVKGRWGGAPRGWRPATKQVMDTLLPEDYVTCITESSDGLIWLGFRQQGYAALDPKTFRVVFSGTQKSDGLPDDYVTCILPMPDYRPYVGTYGGGVARAKKPMKTAGAKPEAKAAMKVEEKTAALPSPAKAPTLAELKATAERLAKSATDKLQPQKSAVVPCSDDWKTQGDFYGADKYQNYRYGEWLAHLCAHSSPFDAVWGRRTGDASCSGRTGVHAKPGEALRHWVHWVKTDKVRCLKNPMQGGRRQAEWDDHKEEYDMTHEGPGLFVDVELPAGPCRLALYIMNKDGHEGNNRFRDYLVTVKPYCRTDVEFVRAPVLARSRVYLFWGGVYKNFVVMGGRRYTIQIHPNGSFNTILSGVFVDPLIDSSQAKTTYGDIPRVQHGFAAGELGELVALDQLSATSVQAQAFLLLAALQPLRQNNPMQFAQEGRPNILKAIRGLRAESEPVLGEELLSRAQAECFHHLRWFDQRDAIYQKLPDRNSELRELLRKARKKP